MSRKRIYLDNNADTQECKESIKARQLNLFGNPSSSIHEEGRQAKLLLENARTEFSQICDAPTVIFTSGATESNHLAITAGMAASGKHRLVTTGMFEHPSVSRIAQAYDSMVVKINNYGEIDMKHLQELCSEPDVGLVSIILAHNELGIVQDQEGLRHAIFAARRNRESHLPVFHVDTTQLLGKTTFSFNKSGVDLASWSAHKFHGPSGIGGLLMKDTEVIKPYPECCSASKDPNGQEMGLRAGTENVLGIIGATTALHTSYLHKEKWKHTSQFCNLIAQQIIQKCPVGSIQMNAYPLMKTINPKSTRLCNTIHLSFKNGISGHDVAIELDNTWGIAVSTGSACSRSAPSQALAAAGFTPDSIRGAIRITPSPIYNEDEDVEKIVEAIVKSFRTARVMV